MSISSIEKHLVEIKALGKKAIDDINQNADDYMIFNTGGGEKGIAQLRLNSYENMEAPWENKGAMDKLRADMKNEASNKQAANKQSLNSQTKDILPSW